MVLDFLCRLSDLETVYPDCSQVDPIPWSPAAQWKGSIGTLMPLKIALIFCS
jgi:hypothetical protein